MVKRTCYKIVYKTFEDAKMNARRQKREFGYMHPYKCRPCKGYHIGHPRSSRIDKLPWEKI